MKLTVKGQVTVPAGIRDYLGVAPRCDVRFHIVNGAVVLEKAQPEKEKDDRFAELRGVLKRGPGTGHWMKATRGM